MRSVHLAAVLALLLAPTATAAVGTLSLSSPDPVRFEGSVDIGLPGGTGFVRGEADAVDVVLRGVTGEMIVSTQHSTRTPLTQLPQEETSHQRVALANATLVLTVRREFFSVASVSEEGTYRVRATVDDAGVPVRVQRETPPGIAFQPPAFQEPERLDLTWRQGWLAFGTTTPDRLPMEAYPAVDAGTLELSGAHRVHLFGGNLTYPDAAGAPRVLRLGAWETPGTVPSSPAAWTVVWRQAVLDAHVQEVRVPLAADWGVAGPEGEWRVDGTFRWTGATGDADVEGARRAFEDAAVTLDAAATFRAQPPAVGALQPPAYAGEGDFRSLRIDGALVASPASPSVAAPAASLTVGALVLLLLTKAGQALVAAGAASLYTRLGPGDVLRHPQRQRIHEAVAASPGIHQRELHRRVGGAWGPFAFHLRMLAKAGHVRVVRQGAYTLVFPAGSGAAAVAVAIPHPVARAIYDAVPTDGSPVFLTEVVATVGVSRELVGYHLRALEARGLVRRVELPGARRGVARVAPSPPANPAGA